MIGQTLSRYKILSKLGEGGMGQVYLAEDTELGRRVALKLLPPGLAGKPERLERFRREARAVAALNHPNIVTIFNVEEADGQRLLIMEHVEGRSLDRIIPGEGLPLSRVFDIAIPTADALAAAHARGITHRDLKPANIMVTSDGLVKVLDFGLAKLAAEATEPADEHAETEVAPSEVSLTGEGVVMGTAPYMSPEQLKGLPVDPRTDIFSLGIVLYEMTTGERPFEGTSGLELASSILKDSPSSVTDIRSDLPRHLGRIIQHCLEKDPERRFQSIKDVRNELDALRKEVDAGAPTAGSQSAIEPSLSREPNSGVDSGASKASSPPAPSSVLPVPEGRRGLMRLLAALALLIMIATAWWLGRGDAASVHPGPAAEATGDRSLAVLPFADLSPEADQGYFTDGMTEELLSALGRVDGIRVPSRTAVFALKDKELGIDQVGERLGVETVLEGSVRKAGNRLRISTQLVQVSDGFQLWSEVYDRDLEDVFSVQDEIARSIASALSITLAGDPRMDAELGGTSSSKAYDFLLQGNDYFARNDVEAFEYATQLYERALAVDPDYALAWAQLSKAHTTLSIWKGDPNNNRVANTASARALELEPRLAEAQLARATYLSVLVGEDEAAVAAFEEAIRLDERVPDLYWMFGNHYYTRGDLERAAALWERQMEVDPANTRVAQVIPQVYVSLGQPEKEQEALRRALRLTERHLELNPDDLNAQVSRASALVGLGHREEALGLVQPVLDSGSLDLRLLYNLACFYSVAGEVDLGIQALTRSAELGYSSTDWARTDSDLDNLRDDPRFPDILEQIEANLERGRVGGHIDS